MTIGVAAEVAAIRQLEDNHNCNQQVSSAPRPIPLASRRIPSDDSLSTRLLRHLNKNRRRRNGLFLASVALLLYVLPTLFEMSALRTVNPWLAVVLPGDLAGCACLALIFRKMKFAASLYVALTAMEALLYVSHLASMHALLWFADLVPTLVVAANVLRLPGENAELITIP